MLKSVLLPQPLGPTMVTNSPSATLRSNGWRTGTRPPVDLERLGDLTQGELVGHAASGRP